MKLAIYQGSGTPCDVPKNLELLEHFAQTAAQQGADFLILPELFLTGYNIGDRAKQFATTRTGEPLQQAARIAREQTIALLFGYPEEDAGQFYNSAALFNADGELVASYRKTHLFGPEERRLFTPGDQWVVVAIAGIQVGILICFDVEFPEAVRALTQAGAELIAVPTANMFPYTQIPNLLVPVRALENQVYIAYVNRSGTEGNLTYCGLSCIVGPNGKDLARAGLEEELLFAEVDREAIAQERTVYSYLDERRSDLYGI
jgi:predicted amidohydrolase